MVTERRPETVATSTESELRAAVAARDELIAVMGHELRNAMAPLVLLGAQFELMPAVDDMMRKKVAMLSRNLKTFTMTLDRISEVAQLRQGKLELDRASVDAADVVHEVCEDFRTLAIAGGCALHHDTTSVVGNWDRDRLKQIVTHLVSNAIRYASAAPIDVTVREVAGALELVVQDDGPGIAPEERERLFDRFERKGARRHGGLGVGLWVVKALTEAMGGSVRLLESERGARFLVTLPRG